MAFWQHPDLLLAQTCGLPYSRFLSGSVGLVGTPSYDIGCSAGRYYSVIIAGPKVRAEKLNELAGLRFAANDVGSQSGFSAPLWTLQQTAPKVSGTLHWRVTGSHRCSIQAVASGAADVAAIDAVSWAMAQRFEPAARQVRVLTHTAATPGLPWISAFSDTRTLHRLHRAVVHGMAMLNEPTREALLLTGFNRTRPTDYQTLAAQYPQRHGDDFPEGLPASADSDSKCRL